MIRGSTLAKPSTAAAVVAAFLLFSPMARAADATATSTDPLPTQRGEFTLRLQPGVSFPLTAPQSQRFDTGGSLTVKGLWSLNRYLGVGPSIGFLALPAADGVSRFGTAWSFGGSLLLQRPRDLPDNDRFYNVSPWVDVDAQYVRTGPLNRPGLAIGAGAAVPLGKSRAYWLGPFVRYGQIIQPSRSGYDNRDAKLLTVGISLDLGPGVKRPVLREAALPAEVRTEVQQAFACTDRDADGVPDDVDRCPDVAGTWENHGCPAEKKVAAQPVRLQLNERLYFAWDQSVILPASLPALDEVVRSLQGDRAVDVRIEGHASSEGESRHNQALSERRATAVRDYLVTHGIAKERLGSKGFSSSNPAASNDTNAGREKNRRVEFQVNAAIATHEGK